MKLLHAKTNTLSDKEFDNLCDNIIDAIYDIEPDIRDLFEIHINMVNDDWVVDFVPLDDTIPILKVSAYTAYDDRNREVLQIAPERLDKFPEFVNVSNYSSAIDVANKLSIVGDFMTSLFDFSYKL